ncbi:MAG: LLM class flavin-dependent oxidoreductase [Acidimicrobiales bacterium]
MKVRIGVGGAGASPSGEVLAETCAAMESLGFDSIWLADILSQPVDDPLVALAYVAGRVSRLKIGTTLVLPGRNPVRLARDAATLDRLSGGRLLLTVVPGIRRRVEQAAMGVAAADREAQMDEMLPLLRRLWSGEETHHDGPRWQLSGVRAGVTPLQDPFDVWTGGIAARALERTGKLADGWLPAMCTPDEAARGRQVIEEHAAAAGRTISPEHFGVSIGYLHGPPLPEVERRITARRQGVEASALVPFSLGQLRDLLEKYIDIGFSKFVVRPLAPPERFTAELDTLAKHVLDLQR